VGAGVDALYLTMIAVATAAVAAYNGTAGNCITLEANA
jgi:hypothetical protein